MSSKPKNKMLLRCSAGPCASGVGPGIATDVVIEVRERGVTKENPLEGDLVEATLTSHDRSRQFTPSSLVNGPTGELFATFLAVPQGWYRALAVRRDTDGKIHSSAARNVQIVKIKGGPAPEPQPVLLILSERGVAVFAFTDDIDSTAMKGLEVVVRHPDGSEQNHTTDAAGKIRIPGGVGDVFSVLRFERIHASVSAVSHTSNGRT